MTELDLRLSELSGETDLVSLQETVGYYTIWHFKNIITFMVIHRRPISIYANLFKWDDCE